MQEVRGSSPRATIATAVSHVAPRPGTEFALAGGVIGFHLHRHLVQWARLLPPRTAAGAGRTLDRRSQVEYSSGKTPAADVQLRSPARRKPVTTGARSRASKCRGLDAEDSCKSVGPHLLRNPSVGLKLSGALPRVTLRQSAGTNAHCFAQDREGATTPLARRSSDCRGSRGKGLSEKHTPQSKLRPQPRSQQARRAERPL